jgi:hypothetical protein
VATSTPTRSASPAASTSSASPEKLLQRVTRAIDTLTAAGDRYHGLFPSIVDRHSGVMLETLPPGIAGQRTGDRSHLGSNLIHDQTLLATMYALADAIGRPDYRIAADRYLQRFATHCTTTETGLFPWGEHSYWHLTEDRVGNSYSLREGHPPRNATHDHLRQAPLWLWEKLWSSNPRCVERFSEGLEYHWKSGTPFEYTRHASIEVKEYPTHAPRACDFPRHGGFYILDWAFAHTRTGRLDFIQQIERMLDHWWNKRGLDGLLQTESRTPAGDPHYRAYTPSQTLSLATSLFETAPLLDDSQPGLAKEMRHRASTYLNGFFAAPHNLERGVFALMSDMDTREVRRAMPVWGSVYGVWPASYVALTTLRTYRMVPDPRLLEWATVVGERYAAEPFPSGVQVPAMDSGLGLGLLADLFDITGERRWLDAGLSLASSLEHVYWDGDEPLPRGAAGIDWYESQMGPSFLLHGLARIALLAQDSAACPLAADYTAR